MCEDWVEDLSKYGEELVVTAAEQEFEDQLAREAQKLCKVLKAESAANRKPCEADQTPAD